VRIALAQIDSTVGDLEGNARLLVERAQQACAMGADIVAFPELAVSGYPPEDLLLKDHFLLDCREALLHVAAACPDIVALVGVPLSDGRDVFNAAAVLVGGAMVGYYRKLLLPNYAVFDEKRYFTPGDRVAVLRIAGALAGLSICEDIWDDCGPTVTAAHSGGAQVIINLSMSPYHVGKGREREQMLSTRARETLAFVCYVNGVGGQDELVFDGQSLVLDPSGSVIGRARQFEQELLVVDLDLASARKDPDDQCPERKWSVEIIDVGGHRDAQSADSFDSESVGRSCGAAGEGPTVPFPAIISEPLSIEAEVYAALCLGVRDYVAKNGFQQVVMGLSGGVDSALTACIAADALGRDRVNAVSMPSRYSSAGTKSDARETAGRLGTRFYEIPIEGVYRSYLESLAPYFVSDEPGVTEQNIQARIRGNVLMALSNKLGWLVLTTGNKSETAVGYATLYGDMAGGFAVLKDVPKTLVYKLSEYRNSLGPGLGPIPASTIQRAPSAELADDQTDQDTLPPYDILDRIIEAYVVRDESVDEIVAGGLPRTEVERAVAMIDGNEYKRRQAAPGVRITPKAFGKDRRLPVTNRYRG
jgi:NAD+ synthase (glutamine-hydrolysing)